MRLPTHTLIRRRVRRGARFLERHGHPDFRAVVFPRVQRLDITSIYNCTLGLTFGTYMAGCRELGLDYVHDGDQLVNLGFAIPDDVPGQYVRILNEEWKKEITLT